MTTPKASEPYYLRVSACVRKWVYFAHHGDGLVHDGNYQMGSGKIWIYLAEALDDDEETLDLKIKLEDGSVENLPEEVTITCEVDGSSDFDLTDSSGIVLARWPKHQRQEVPSALLSPSIREPVRWTIDLDVEDGKIIGWPTGQDKEQALNGFKPEPDKRSIDDLLSDCSSLL